MSNHVAPSSLADGRYEVEETLGSGGMGIVVRARDRELGRDVAVKLLADNLALDTDARERFAREARAAARLNHPNMVQVFDVGEQDDRPYLVMELVDGPSLSDRLAADDPPVDEELLEIARQALDALEHAHSNRLLHRDIKPANLLISPEGTLKVTDFGVAEVAEAPGLTRTGHVLGTMPYLAPERLRGEPATPQSDLFALGATLHEVATGAPPRDERPLPDELPPRLRLLVERCLAQDPDERPESAAAARQLLAGADPTRVLKADATTVAVEAGTDGSQTGTRDASTEDRTTDRAPWARFAVIGGVILLLLMVVVVGGGEDTPQGNDTENATEAPAAEPTVAPIERGEDPATTARNIADWIRDHGGG